MWLATWNFIMQSRIWGNMNPQQATRLQTILNTLRTNYDVYGNRAYHGASQNREYMELKSFLVENHDDTALLAAISTAPATAKADEFYEKLKNLHTSLLKIQLPATALPGPRPIVSLKELVDIMGNAEAARLAAAAPAAAGIPGAAAAPPLAAGGGGKKAAF